MFKKWFTSDETEVIERPSELQKRNVEKSYTLNEIIQDIHNSFYGEQDNLTNWANEKLSTETKLQSLIDKSERLKKLGFTNSSEVKDAQIEIDRLNKIKSENSQKEEFINAVNYFGMKYPNMKVITFDSVKKLCEKYEKYGLIYGDVQYYKGTVPDKNLAEIEKCKDIEDDWLWVSFYRNWGLSSEFMNKSIMTSEKIKEERLDYHNRKKFEKSPLIIIAPKSDFDTSNMTIKDFELVPIPIKDPVVGCPLYYNGNRYFGILSAWGGEEANDEIVVNQKFN